MTSDRLDHHASELQREHDRFLDDARRRSPGPGAAETLIGLKFRAGQRVFDRISGKEGTVLAGRKENTVLPPSRRGNG